MTRRDRQLALALAGLAAALLLSVGIIAASLWLTLEPAERGLVGPVLLPRVAVAIFVAMLVLLPAALLLHRLFVTHVDAPAELLDQVRVLVQQKGRCDLPQRGSAANRGLAQAVATLLQERNRLRDDMARQVAEASHDIEQERSRLAALMSELKQSVVVCNLEGRILLYNNGAVELFRSLQGSRTAGSGAGLIGLGRSIHAVFEREIIGHALDRVRSRLRDGARSPSSQFVTTTAAAHLLRVRMTAVPALRRPADVGDPADEPADEPARSGAGAGGGADDDLDGFVLMIDDITREFALDSQRDELLLQMTEGSRASLAVLQAAVETLALPDLEAQQRDRFVAVIHEEVVALADRVRAAAADAARESRTRWPLEDMLGIEFVAAARSCIESLPDGPRVEGLDVDPALWLKVDSFALLQAIGHLAVRLRRECGVAQVRLRLSAAASRARLDLAWSGEQLDSATVAAWQDDAIRIAGRSLPLSVDDVVGHHGGEFWFEREPPGGGFFRFLLPLADDQDERLPASQSLSAARPEFYDFGLFRSTPQSRQLDESLLSELSYTVFDTEATGLDPSGGDEIIQIGATRIVNGKLLKAECFDQLVDPQRAIAPASFRIHGLSQAALRGKPTIAEVLPSFHAFAAETVLVGHNAAFDMRFLELKQAIAGVRFDHAVLDTLLLAAVVHPDHASHGLEDIAGRLDIAVAQRHDALADALLTAEIFLRLLPLLQSLGIRTLAEARAASLSTYYGRLRY